MPFVSGAKKPRSGSGFPEGYDRGLIFPIERLPIFLRPLSYVLPPTYGIDILHGAFGIGSAIPIPIDFALLIVFCIGLFFVSLRNIQKRWII
jgi:ABC-2 type transport system permease protein